MCSEQRRNTSEVSPPQPANIFSHDQPVQAFRPYQLYQLYQGFKHGGSIYPHLMNLLSSVCHYLVQLPAQPTRYYNLSFTTLASSRLNLPVIIICMSLPSPPPGSTYPLLSSVCHYLVHLLAQPTHYYHLSVTTLASSCSSTYPLLSSVCHYLGQLLQFNLPVIIICLSLPCPAPGSTYPLSRVLMVFSSFALYSNFQRTTTLQLGFIFKLLADN